MKLTYLESLADARTQYAIMTGRVDDTNEREVVQFLEDVMREAANKIDVPEYGYIVIDNMYAHFVRKIRGYIEDGKESNLEKVLSLIDKGYLKRHSVDKERSAVYYTTDHATLAQMKRLHKATSLRLDRAIAEYERRLAKNIETFSMPESVSRLTKRIKTQESTIHFLEEN